MALLPWVLPGKGCPCREARLSLRCPSAHLGFKVQAHWARGLEEANEFLQKRGWDGERYTEGTYTRHLLNVTFQRHGMGGARALRSQQIPSPLYRGN